MLTQTLVFRSQDARVLTMSLVNSQIERVLSQSLTVKRQNKRVLTQSLVVKTQDERVLTQSLTVKRQCERELTQSLVVKDKVQHLQTQRLISNRQGRTVLTQGLVVKVEVQKVLVINLSNLDDGLIVQVLLQALDLAAHQLVGLVRLLAAVLQQVVCVLHLPARLLLSESADRLCVASDVPTRLLCRLTVGLVCTPEAHIHIVCVLHLPA